MERCISETTYYSRIKRCECFFSSPGYVLIPTLPGAHIASFAYFGSRLVVASIPWLFIYSRYIVADIGAGDCTVLKYMEKITL